MQRPRSPRRIAASAAGLCLLLVAALALPTFASDTPDPASVALPGSFQDELGCPGRSRWPVTAT